MTIRADVDKKFIRRFLYISIGCFLFMLWGLYDGLVTSPRELERSLKYEELTRQHENGEITQEQRSGIWQTVAKENSWAISQPKKPADARNYVYFQWFVFGVGLLLGVFFLQKYLRLLNSWMEADGSGIATSWGQSIQFDKIQSINKWKWEKKGIAKIAYSDAQGVSRVMVLDDFKYDRESIGQIMTQAEKKLADDQIVGGPRQSEVG